MAMMTSKIRNYSFKRRMLAKKLIINRDSVSMTSFRAFITAFTYMHLFHNLHHTYTECTTPTWPV
jgi:hypothetical protein